MNFKGGKVRLARLREYKTKTDRIMHFVTIADPVTCLGNDFVLDSEYNVAGDLVVGHDYDVTLVVDGKYSKVQLTPLAK